MPEFTVEYDAACEKCGSVLSVESETLYGGAQRASVKPCETCLEKADVEAYDRGYRTRDGEEY